MSEVKLIPIIVRLYIHTHSFFGKKNGGRNKANEGIAVIKENTAKSSQPLEESKGKISIKIKERKTVIKQ